MFKMQDDDNVVNDFDNVELLLKRRTITQMGNDIFFCVFLRYR